MRALSRSYGLISIFTLSPAAILMKCLRSLPEICASTMWPLSSCTRNIVPGRTVVILPSTSITLPSDIILGEVLAGLGHADGAIKAPCNCGFPSVVNVFCGKHGFHPPHAPLPLRQGSSVTTHAGRFILHVARLQPGD